MKVSLITVCFNSEATIEDTLRSVASQSFQNVEHIVIDGGSTDATLSILNKHRGRLSRVVSEPDRGIYDAMNKGLALATGAVVGFLNSDDTFADSSALERIANAFEDESIQVAYADLVYVTNDNTRVARLWKSKPYVVGDFSKGWSPAHPTFYVRRELIEQLGTFDRSYKLAADFEFMVRYMSDGKVKASYLPHVLVRMRLGGATNQSWKNILQQNREIFAALRKNGVRFSRIWFTINKLANRLNQVFLARFMQFR